MQHNPMNAAQALAHLNRPGGRRVHQPNPHNAPHNLPRANIARVNNNNAARRLANQARQPAPVAAIVAPPMAVNVAPVNQQQQQQNFNAPAPINAPAPPPPLPAVAPPRLHYRYVDIFFRGAQPPVVLRRKTHIIFIFCYMFIAAVNPILFSIHSMRIVFIAMCCLAILLFCIHFTFILLKMFRIMMSWYRATLNTPVEDPSMLMTLDENSLLKGKYDSVRTVRVCDDIYTYLNMKLVGSHTSSINAWHRASTEVSNAQHAGKFIDVPEDIVDNTVAYFFQRLAIRRVHFSHCVPSEMNPGVDDLSN
jgi:hypothetical protein